jgi:AraC-like DNA-binding protein
MIEMYHEIIEKLVAKCSGANLMALINPFSLHQAYTVDHFLLRNEGTTICYSQVGQEPILLLPGNFLFIPSRKEMNISLGEKDAPCISANYFIANYKNYLRPFAKTEINSVFSGLSYISLDMHVLGGINLFSLLDVPAFVISPNANLVSLYNYMLSQQNIYKIGRSVTLNYAACLLAIELIHYLFDHIIFIDTLTTKLKYLNDERITTILTYINQNLDKDLYNKVLASLANISEDYMGQYFKLVMNERPQSYVEYQRMKKAIVLLQTTSKTIHEIIKEIGLKDPAYFCRRFKNLFGVQPTKTRIKDCIAIFQSK